MVNFYNDYVTCSKTANTSDVAGMPKGLFTLNANLIRFVVVRNFIQF